MTTEVILKKNIEIKPCQLNENYQESILEKLKNFQCTQSIGYINEIVCIQKIECLPIGRSSNPVFGVTFKANILKPDPKTKFLSKINIINNSGVLLEYKQIKLFVPKNSDIELDIKNKSFTFKNKIFNVKDEIMVEVTLTKYEKHNFICVGKFVL
jgi:DNA-directed RNA polymerase subunit E'/Rpb7